MSDYYKEIQDVYMKHGSGSTDLASAIIHLESENNELREDYNRVMEEQNTLLCDWINKLQDKLKEKQ